MSDENVGVQTEDDGKKGIARKAVGISKEAKLTLMVDANPKRPGRAAYDRFEGYFKEGVETVQDALDAGLTLGDIKYDLIHGFIDVEGAIVEEYETTKRGPRSKKSGGVDENLMESGESVGLLSDDVEEDVL